MGRHQGWDRDGASRSVAHLIDTRNGGQPCTECIHYRESGYARRDRLFGMVPVHNWCVIKDRAVADKREGYDCPVFEKKEPTRPTSPAV